MRSAELAINRSKHSCFVEPCVREYIYPGFRQNKVSTERRACIRLALFRKVQGTRISIGRILSVWDRDVFSPANEMPQKVQAIIPSAVVASRSRLGGFSSLGRSQQRRFVMGIYDVFFFFCRERR